MICLGGEKPMKDDGRKDRWYCTECAWWVNAEDVYLVGGFKDRLTGRPVIKHSYCQTFPKTFPVEILP